jgi:hypothetical protein
MYCGARMSSQGNQRTYTATKIPKDDREFNPANIIQRSNAGQYNGFFNENEDYEKYKEIIPPPPALLRHEVSESLATPYRTASNMRVMREVSGCYQEKEESVNL